MVKLRCSEHRTKSETAPENVKGKHMLLWEAHFKFSLCSSLCLCFHFLWILFILTPLKMGFNSKVNRNNFDFPYI